uniref:Uncharacterized protein n=1 Tax=Ascaris lumbricoides TaxID=6252 RepID=A0A9J2P8C4_ASCLU
MINTICAFPVNIFCTYKAHLSHCFCRKKALLTNSNMRKNYMSTLLLSNVNVEVTHH